MRLPIQLNVFYCLYLVCNEYTLNMHIIGDKLITLCMRKVNFCSKWLSHNNSYSTHNKIIITEPNFTFRQPQFTSLN